MAALDTLSALDFVGTRSNQQIVSVSVPKCWRKKKKRKHPEEWLEDGNNDHMRLLDRVVQLNVFW